MRLREFQSALRQKGIDGAIFLDNDPTITYFAKVALEQGALAVPAKGAPTLFVPGFEAGRVGKEADCKTEKTSREYVEKAARSVGGVIGVLPKRATLASANELAAQSKVLTSVEQLCTQLRSQKTKEEIARITKACALTDVLFEELVSVLPSCKTEREAESMLKWFMAQWGIEPSFSPIIAAGKNAAIPHHRATDAKLKGFVVIDFGIVCKNYCSDMTRTIYVGKPSAKEKKAYEKVRETQQACVEKVQEGVAFKDIDTFAKERIGKSMIHSVGHSLGIEVHDVAPRPWTLTRGNVVTIEPGSYPGPFGIRIEDDVVVSKKGRQVLSQSPKELLVYSPNI